MLARTRTRLARGAAALLLATAAAACSDFLAAPARGPAQLTVAYALSGDGTPPRAQEDAFDQVDALRVRLERETGLVMDTTFPTTGGGAVIRHALSVELLEAEEEMALEVELLRQGEPVFAGSRAVRLVRGARVAAEVTLHAVGGTGALSVRVANAVTGLPLPGATVAVRAGASAPATAPVAATAVTGADGRARFAALAAGPYTLFVSAPAMIDAVVPDVSVAAGGETVENVVLSPVLAAGETRIVLTWDGEPGDLDSHLTGPNGAGGTFHVYFGNQTSGSAASPDVELDVDDTDGFGPETITIRRQFAGSYCFSVRNFDGDSRLGASGAQVKVFRGSQQVAAYAVPATTSLTWTVFRLNGTTLTPVNTTGSSVPGVCP